MDHEGGYHPKTDEAEQEVQRYERYIESQLGHVERNWQEVISRFKAEFRSLPNASRTRVLLAFDRLDASLERRRKQAGLGLLEAIEESQLRSSQLRKALG